MRDLIVRIAGPNRSFQPHEPYSQAHFDRVGGYLPGIERYRNVFFDTVTAASRLCFRWASAQPEAFSERTGKPDLRGAYGLHAREMSAGAASPAERARLNVILIGALETVTDDYGRIEHRLQAEGQRVPREIAGIVDIVVTMHWLEFRRRQAGTARLRLHVAQSVGVTRRKIAAGSWSSSSRPISAP